MGAKTPAAGGETKPVVKHEGRPPYHGGHNNANKNNNYNKHADGTVLHIMGDIEEIENEIENNDENDEDVSSKLSSDSNASYDTEYDTETEELMFIQPHIHSQGEKQSVCSKNLILKTWILLDSQSTLDVISSGDLLTKMHRVKTYSESDVIQDWKQHISEAIYQGVDGYLWFYPDGSANFYYREGSKTNTESLLIVLLITALEYTKIMVKY